MPGISNPKKLVSIQSRSPTPTNDQIAHLILDQKTPAQAIQTFKWASKLPHFSHSQSTYRALIHKLSTFRDFKTIHQLLDEMPHSINEAPDESIFVTLVRDLGKAHMVKEAIKMVDLVSLYGRDRVTLKLLNSVLDVLVKEDIEIARGFYRRKMVNEFGFVGDDYTFGILMKGLCRTNRIGDAFKLLQTMKRKGVKPNTVIYNTLIHALCRNGKVGRARSFMHEMTEHNEVTFNIMISAYCVEENENLIQALVLLDKCFNLGFSPDVITVTKLLELLCNKGRAMEGLEILERVESKGGVIDVVFYNTLIKGFCKLAKVKVGCRFLKEMERKGILPSVDTYNILISGFCDLGKLDSALDIFNDMKTSAVCGDFITHDTLIRGLCYGARIKDAYKILELMQESRKGSEGRISPYNSIIYGLYKENRIQEALVFLTKMEKLFPRAVNRSVTIINFCQNGNIDDAKLVYDQLIAEGGVPNVLIYACLIHACCQKRHVREAFEMINEMVRRRLFPIASTFNVLINSFCKEDMVGSGLKLLEDMVGRGCLPDIESYRPLVDDFCSKDEFEKMIMVFEEMVENGVVPDYGIWCLMMNSLQSRDEMVNLVESII